jgi:hypothetical protein
MYIEKLSPKLDFSCKKQIFSTLIVKVGYGNKVQIITSVPR